MKDPLEEIQVADSPRAGKAFLAVLIGGLLLLALVVPGSRIPLIIVAGIVVMVMLHEAGHYFAARWAGMKATEFFLGFGRPKLFSFRRGETEFGVKPIALGGYVRIVGMTNLEDVDPEDEPRSFRQGTTGKRMVVILAGVTMNFLLAYVLFFIVIVGPGSGAGRAEYDALEHPGEQRGEAGGAPGRRPRGLGQRHRDQELGPVQEDHRRPR